MADQRANPQTNPLPNPMQRFAVTPDEITRVLDVFYARVRHHPELGPVFNAHIGTTDTEWVEHIEKINRFWRNAILRERVYDGNPMRVHVNAGDIKTNHFAPWLGMFEEVLRAELSPDIADSWMALAQRIGRGFQMQMEDMRRPTTEVPKLF